MRRVGALIAPAMLALGIFAATAIAGGDGVKIVQHTDTNQTKPVSSHSVACPGHNQLLGGGFSAPVTTLVQKSKPTGLFGWKSETYVFGGPPGDVTTYAFCNTAGERRLTRVAGKVTLPAGSGPGAAGVGGAAAKCPRGSQLVSGGYQVKPKFNFAGSTGEVTVDTSMPKGTRTWVVHGGNEGAPTKLIAIGLCERKGKTQIDQAQDSVQGDSSTSPITATATCEKGTHLVGGGFQVTPNESAGDSPAVVSTAAPTDSRHWKTVSAGAPVGPAPAAQTLTSYAQCEHG